MHDQGIVPFLDPQRRRTKFYFSEISAPTQVHNIPYPAHWAGIKSPMGAAGGPACDSDPFLGPATLEGHGYTDSSPPGPPS